MVKVWKEDKGSEQLNCSSLFFFLNRRVGVEVQVPCVVSTDSAVGEGSSLLPDKNERLFLTLRSLTPPWWEVRTSHFYLVNVAQAPHLAVADGVGLQSFQGCLAGVKQYYPKVFLLVRLFFFTLLARESRLLLSHFCLHSLTFLDC